MILNELIKICRNSKIELRKIMTNYGNGFEIFIDGLELHYGSKEFDFLIDWIHVDLIHAIIDKFEILDSFDGIIYLKNEQVFFDLKFNNSWKYDIDDGGEEVTIFDLLPYLPDFINQFEEFSTLVLDEDLIFCSFTYEKNYGEDERLVIQDLWCEEPKEISFMSNDRLIQELSQEINCRIQNQFEESQELFISSEDGISISIYSTYKEEFSFEDLFD
jgi:hypothetical protein